MFINHSTKEINLRIVYCGPAGAETEANLRSIFDRTDPQRRGRVYSSREPVRSTVFDFVPDLSEIQGFRVRVHLVALLTDPGSPPCDISFLSDIDGLVFVSDASLEENTEAFWALRSVVESLQYSWEQMPLVIQLNAPSGSTPPAGAQPAIIYQDRPQVRATTSMDIGILETLDAILREVMAAYGQGLLRQWQPAPEERGEDPLMARRRIAEHFSRYFGVATDELSPPSPTPGVPEYVVLTHAPVEGRPFFTYATAGFSNRSTEPRIELVAYASFLNPALLDSLGMVGSMISTSDPTGAPWKAFDTVDLGPHAQPYRHFLLVPTPEVRGFSPYREDQQEVEAAHGGTRVEILQLLPMPAAHYEAVLADSYGFLSEMRATNPTVGWEEWMS